MASVPDLIALIYRADWTRLSLSATISWRRDPDVDAGLLQAKTAAVRQLLGPLPALGPGPGWQREYLDRQPHDGLHRLTVAPGGRWRRETADGTPVSICDGQHRWLISDGAAERGAADGPDEGWHGLLTPQWLLACYDLDFVGNETHHGRPAVRLLGTPKANRLGNRGWSIGGIYDFLDRVELLIDTELGIGLRSDQIYGGQVRETAELTDLVVSPDDSAPASMFTPPPDLRVTDENARRGGLPEGPAWRLAGQAAGLAASAMGSVVRHAPRPRAAAAPADPEAAMPAGARLTQDEFRRGKPPSDELLTLLQQGGLAGLGIAAELQHWQDPKPLVGRADAVRAQAPAWLEGILGPDAVWSAASQLATEHGVLHKVGRLVASTPGRYRLDHVSGGWPERYTAIACDGQHTTKLFADRVSTGPARPLAAPYGYLLDPAWLLQGWRLRSAGRVTVAGRPCYRLLAEAQAEPVAAHENAYTQMELVLDAELGVLLRQTGFAGGEPAMRTELRELTFGEDPPDEAFRIEPEPGMRTTTDSGGPLADRDLPRPAELAATAGTMAMGGAIAAAVAVTGWLDRQRQRRDETTGGS